MKKQNTIRTSCLGGNQVCQREWSRRSRGMTLIEVLIATTMTLLIMLALAQGFKTLSDGVTAGRSKLTLSDQLRGISSQLRADLSGITCDNQTPQDHQSSNGYFMYYDGPLSDSSAMLFNFVPGAPTVEERLSASRWGDIDDVIMFTAKAEDGKWFRGKVPRALLMIDQHNKGLIPGALTLTTLDWLTDVTIASEFAEIAWFMRPLDELGGINNTELAGAGGYPFAPPTTPVIDVAPSADRTGDGIPDTDGMPDRIALCRRVLLIRPDLQITPNSLINLGTSDIQLSMQPFSPNFASGESFRYMMRFAYQRCDLSVRPIYDGLGLKLATNTLGDLQRPENRFSHYVMPVAGTFSLPVGGTVPSSPASSLPLLALTSEPASVSSGGYLDLTNYAYGAATTVPLDGMLTPLDRGFIPSAFFRTKIKAVGGVVTESSATLEEVVASNVVAFDIRGFDVSAKTLPSAGSDGQWGSAGGVTVNPTVDFGAPGTDDVVVGPCDPGFANLILSLEAGPMAPSIAGNGAFVDLCWGRRVVNQLNNAGGTMTLGGLSHFTKPAALLNQQASIWGSALSGFNTLPSAVSSLPPPSMIKAGKWNIANSIYQPVYDTYTDAYESDGDRQENALWANGLTRFGLSSSTTNPNPDPGNNGVDDDGNGIVDDANERETSPPFVYRMPSIQAKIRVQDRPAGTLQEISIIHELGGY